MELTTNPHRFVYRGESLAKPFHILSSFPGRGNLILEKTKACEVSFIDDVMIWLMEESMITWGCFTSGEIKEEI